MYHICYKVGRINNTIQSFEKIGAKLIIEPIGAVAFNGRMVAFFNDAKYAANRTRRIC